MKYVALICTLCLLTSCATMDAGKETSVANTPDTETVVMVDLAGSWEGSLEAGSRKIPLVFNILENESGELKASLDSPTENVYGIPVDTPIIDGTSVELNIPVTAAVYRGEYEAPDRITGTWNQSGASLVLVLERTADKVARKVAAKPQDPVPPFPYTSTDIEFRNETAGITLGGTITIPQGDGPFPGAVLISGSGQQNRNEEIFGHKPFLVLADALTRSGVAVLRYDDRGIGESEGAETLAEATSVDFGEDALAAFNYLRSFEGVDPDLVGLIGHSEGGIIAPSIAAANPDVAYIVLLAGPGIPGAELVASQSMALMKASGMPADTIDLVDNANRSIYQIVIETKDNQKATEEITSIMKQLGMQQNQIDAQLQSLLSPWYRSFLAYDPAPALEKLDIPVLALNGTLDLQVPYEANLEAIRVALEKAPTGIYRIEALDNLNHLFQTAETGLTTEYATIEETFAPEALEIISGWIADLAK